MELFSRGSKPLVLDDRKQVFEVTEFSPIVHTEKLLIGGMSANLRKNGSGFQTHLTHQITPICYRVIHETHQHPNEF